MSKKRPDRTVLGCLGRTPQPDEFIHPDIASEPAAKQLWERIGWRVEAMAELISPDCPEDLRRTIYFQNAKLMCVNLERIEQDIRNKQAMAKEVLRTGFERTGWPVCRWSGDRIMLMSGTHRLALQKARGVPVRAILLGQKS